MDTNTFAEQYLAGLKSIMDRFDFGAFQQIIHRILAAFHAEQRIFVMGNGGSGATASHFACDINKGCCIDLQKKFKMICLNDNIPTLLALTNDISYAVVFEAQLKNFFEPADLVIGISSSGNSTNVLRAIAYAREHGGRTIGFSGFSGGRLAELAEISYVVPADDVQQIEDMHMILVHMIMQAVHSALHDGKPAGRPIGDAK